MIKIKTAIGPDTANGCFYLSQKSAVWGKTVQTYLFSILQTDHIFGSHFFAAVTFDRAEDTRFFWKFLCGCFDLK